MFAFIQSFLHLNILHISYKDLTFLLGRYLPNVGNESSNLYQFLLISAVLLCDYPKRTGELRSS